MNRNVRTKERLLAQYLLLAALAAHGMLKESNGRPGIGARRSRTNKSRCRCCCGGIGAKKR
jgi:hypothetical protein